MMNRRLIWLLISVFFVGVAAGLLMRLRGLDKASQSASAPSPDSPTLAPIEVDLLLLAMRQVESSGRDPVPAGAAGEVGPLQTGRAAWMDATAQLRREGNSLADLPYDTAARQWWTSQQLARAYWRRWCPRQLAAADLETLARVWNGGPRGASKAATLPYWRKVEAAMRWGD